MNLPYQDPALPDAPTQEDLNQFSTPVAELPQQAVPEKPSKGMSFDFSVIDVQTQDEYNALPPVLKQLRHEIVAYGKRPSPQEAAAMLDRIKTEFDAINSPKAQAQTQAAQLSADKTLLEKKKLEQEQITKAKEQAELDARKSIVLSKIEKYTNPEAPGYVDIAPLVGKFDGTAGTMLDSAGWNDQRSAQRAELERLVNTDVLELTKFLKPVSQDELKFLKSMTPRLHQNDTIWREYLLDAKSRLQPTPQAPAQPAQPAAPATRSIGGRTFIQLPDGSWNER